MSDGHYIYKTKQDVIKAALRFCVLEKGVALCSPKDAENYVRLKLRHEEAEKFCILFLDNRNRVQAFETMFTGTIDGASVYPREVVKRALAHNSAAVVLTHNHPSGVAEPSSADKQITNRLKDALALIEVRVLDHLVVGDKVVSFAERGLL